MSGGESANCSSESCDEISSMGLTYRGSHCPEIPMRCAVSLLVIAACQSKAVWMMTEPGSTVGWMCSLSQVSLSGQRLYLWLPGTNPTPPFFALYCVIGVNV